VTLYRSPACELVDGYTAEERLGHKSCENVHPDDLEGALAALSTLAGGKPQRPIQYRIRRKDGEWRWVESAARSLLDNPSVRAIVVAASDITERRLAEEESGRLSQQLAHAQKMESVGRLAGGIAHDFNNIMSVVLLHADSAQDEIAAGESPADSIAAIHDAALKAIALGQQLMAFSSKQSLHTEVLDLNSVVEDAQKLVTRLIGEDVKVVFQRGAGLSSVRADRGQLGQVIVNLAVNSRDAMPEGGVFTIETAAVEFGDADARRHPEGKPGSYIMMRVRDTGLGMTPETRARIFEPFFSTKEIGKGTGLGLSLVYGIVKQSGGFITVESEPGRGTEFRMYLPAVADTPARSSDGAIPCLRGGSETILLVEDEAPLRHKLRDILQGAGYRVLAASNGYEAAALALGEPGEIDLLLTDVVMPGLSGPRLSQQLRFLRPTTRVLHMSGYPDDIRGSGGRLLRDFIQKPFSREKLLRCVRQTLDATESSITAPSSTGA
jgi:PAS domain S-box-containing protein